MFIILAYEGHYNVTMQTISIVCEGKDTDDLKYILYLKTFRRLNTCILIQINRIVFLYWHMNYI